MYLFRILFVLTIFWIFISTSEMPELLSKFNQGDYKLKFERAMLLRYDKTVYKFMEGKSFKYNRTTTVINGTLILQEDLDEKYIQQMSILVQAYKFLSNEYRHFPVRFQINYCKAFEANAIGLKAIMKCGNITTCPLQRGVTYHLCNFSPEEAKFPPLIPSGSYMVELTVIYRDRPAAVVQGYGTIWRPVA